MTLVDRIGCECGHRHAVSLGLTIADKCDGYRCRCKVYRPTGEARRLPDHALVLGRLYAYLVPRSVAPDYLSTPGRA